MSTHTVRCPVCSAEEDYDSKREADKRANELELRANQKLDQLKVELGSDAATFLTLVAADLADLGGTNAARRVLKIANALRTL